MQIDTTEAIDLLKQLIAIPSLSRQEDRTADVLQSFLTGQGLEVQRIGNNVICFSSRSQESNVPIVVLNSHHDTVKVSEGWTKDPFGAEEIGETIYGLGSNDAGASLVSLLQTFLYFEKYGQAGFDLVFIASAEEEVSGKDGLERVLRELDIEPALAIVGEPTSCAMAVAEKGLIVIDGLAKGKAGHAANQWGDNALYTAVKDIQWIENFEFDKVSEWLGKVKLTVTQIEAGYQHNVVPDTCKFVIDCRINDQYAFEDILNILRENCASELTPRSLRLRPSSIPTSHPIVEKGRSLGLEAYGSNTMSDQVFFTCPSVKIGPGDTNRSHNADEYITRSEIKQGIQTYIKLLQDLRF